MERRTRGYGVALSFIGRQRAEKRRCNRAACQDTDRVRQLESILSRRCGQIGAKSQALGLYEVGKRLDPARVPGQGNVFARLMLRFRRRPQGAARRPVLDPQHVIGQRTAHIGPGALRALEIPLQPKLVHDQHNRPASHSVELGNAACRGQTRPRGVAALPEFRGECLPAANERVFRHGCAAATSGPKRWTALPWKSPRPVLAVSHSHGTTRCRAPLPPRA